MAATPISDGNLAATYALIYSFLTSRSHDKAAAAVKKAAKDIVVLRDDVKTEDALLDEIVKWWKLKKEADVKIEPSSKSESDSSSDSDSNSSSSDDTSDSDSSSSSSDSDSSDSSSSSELEAAKSDSGTPGQKAAKVATLGERQNFDSSSGTGQANSTKRLKALNTMKRGKAEKSSSGDSSSDSDSDSSHSTQAAKSVKVGQAAADASTVKVTVVSDTLSNTVTTRVTKKRRTSESGNAIATAVEAETSEASPTPNQNGKVNGKTLRKSNTPFQRIKAETVEFHDERLKDNAFVSKGGTANDYGARANQDLIVTRGDGFRKEKNKKKRGSYRGGEITMESHSIKFT